MFGKINAMLLAGWGSDHIATHKIQIRIKAASSDGRALAHAGCYFDLRIVIYSWYNFILDIPQIQSDLSIIAQKVISSDCHCFFKIVSQAEL